MNEQFFAAMTLADSIQFGLLLVGAYPIIRGWRGATKAAIAESRSEAAYDLARRAVKIADDALRALQSLEQNRDYERGAALQIEAWVSTTIAENRTIFAGRKYIVQTFKWTFKIENDAQRIAAQKAYEHELVEYVDPAEPIVGGTLTLHVRNPRAA